MGEGAGDGRTYVNGEISPVALEVPANLLFKPLQHAGLNVELLFKVRAHLPLHLVDFPESEHAWADDIVCIVADDG